LSLSSPNFASSLFKHCKEDSFLTRATGLLRGGWRGACLSSERGGGITYKNRNEQFSTGSRNRYLAHVSTGRELDTSALSLRES
jgi:hypothetical protein